VGAEGLEAFKTFFGGGPVGAVAALLLVAVVVLFGLLVKSWHARLEQSARYFAAAEKYRELTTRLVEALEDQRAVAEQRAKRKALALERDTIKFKLPEGSGDGG
jgi:FtsZ-interacting cell division protein ZipA